MKHTLFKLLALPLRSFFLLTLSCLISPAKADGYYVLHSDGTLGEYESSELYNTLSAIKALRAGDPLSKMAPFSTEKELVSHAKKLILENKNDCVNVIQFDHGIADPIVKVAIELGELELVSLLIEKGCKLGDRASMSGRFDDDPASRQAYQLFYAESAKHMILNRKLAAVPASCLMWKLEDGQLIETAKWNLPPELALRGSNFHELVPVSQENDFKLFDFTIDPEYNNFIQVNVAYISPTKKAAQVMSDEYHFENYNEIIQQYSMDAHFKPQSFKEVVSPRIPYAVPGTRIFLTQSADGLIKAVDADRISAFQFKLTRSCDPYQFVLDFDNAQPAFLYDADYYRDQERYPALRLVNWGKAESEHITPPRNNVFFFNNNTKIHDAYIYNANYDGMLIYNVREKSWQEIPWKVAWSVPTRERVYFSNFCTVLDSGVIALVHLSQNVAKKEMSTEIVFMKAGKIIRRYFEETPCDTRYTVDDFCNRLCPQRVGPYIAVLNKVAHKDTDLSYLLLDSRKGDSKGDQVLQSSRYYSFYKELLNDCIMAFAEAGVQH